MSDGAPAVHTRVEYGLGTLELDAPGTRNALNLDLMEALATELERLDADAEARCLLLVGSDEVFASGADPRLLAPGASAMSAPFWERLAAIRTPIVAGASGWALGAGCELALACDMLVAAEGTQFGQPEVTLGIIPGGGATQQLTRTLGKQRAMELVLTGRRFSAEMAARWGLVNAVAPRAGWRQAAFDLAHAVASRAPLATRLAKRAVLAAEHEHLADALETERRLFDEAVATEDRVEGVNAFVEGRPPSFEGR